MYYVLVKFRSNAIPELFGTTRPEHASELATMTDVEWVSPTIVDGNAVGESWTVGVPGIKLAA